MGLFVLFCSGGKAVILFGFCFVGFFWGRGGGGGKKFFSWLLIGSVCLLYLCSQIAGVFLIHIKY